MLSLLPRSIARLAARRLNCRYIAHEFHSIAQTREAHPTIKIRRGQNQTVVTTIREMSSSGPIYTVEYLCNKLKNDLQAEHIDMEDLSNCGCGMKFDAVIVSPQFEGKPILQRQRLVNQVLSEEMKHIHAFTMRTLTPSQWKEAQDKIGQGTN